MLPNSIERTAPIVGYDPYAFITGKKSNLTYAGQPLHKNAGLDYYAKNPENMYTDGERANKKFKIPAKIKKILGTAALIGGAVALIKFKGSKCAKGLKGKLSEQFTKLKDSFKKKP